MKHSFLQEILEPTSAKGISFAGGLPNSTLFPLDALKDAAVEVLSHPRTLQYIRSSGYVPLKEKIAQFYRDKGFATTADEILITSGSQQALDLIARHYSGRAITVEAPCYLGAMNVFRLNHLPMQSVDLYDDGIKIKCFRKSFQETKLAYVIPDFQNPSGYTYSIKKREKVAQSVLAYDGILIEDSPYSKLYFEKPYPCISKLIPSNSYHLGSFSKTLAPSLRVGWIRADKRLLEPLISYKEAMDLHTNGLAQMIIDHYLEEQNHYRKHLKHVRRFYKKQMQAFTTTLDTMLPELVYTTPKGGMFVYGQLPHVNTSKLVRGCMQKEVAFIPGEEFYTTGQKRDELRFSFTNVSKKEMRKGLQIINTVLKESF